MALGARCLPRAQWLRRVSSFQAPRASPCLPSTCSYAKQFCPATTGLAFRLQGDEPSRQECRCFINWSPEQYGVPRYTAASWGSGQSRRILVWQSRGSGSAAFRVVVRNRCFQSRVAKQTKGRIGYPLQPLGADQIPNAPGLAGGAAHAREQRAGCPSQLRLR